MEAPKEPSNQDADKEGKEDDGNEKTQNTNNLISDMPSGISSCQTTDHNIGNLSNTDDGVSDEQNTRSRDHRDTPNTQKESSQDTSDRPIANLCRAFKNVLSRNFPFVTNKPAPATEAYNAPTEHQPSSQASRRPSLSRSAPGPTSESDFASPKSPLLSHLDSVSTHPFAPSNAEDKSQKLTHSKNKSSSPYTPQDMVDESSSKQDSTPTMVNSVPQSVSGRSSVSNGQQTSNATHGHSTAQSSVSLNSTDRQSIPVTSIKGELVVTVLEGRGLRPSFEPYIICVFELNEDISHGAERSRDDPEAEAAAAAQSLLWNTSDEAPSDKIAIQRPTNPLRIPTSSTVKSSKSTPAARAENGKQDVRMTDPQWNHRVVLYVDDFKKSLWLGNKQRKPRIPCWIQKLLTELQ